MYSSGAKRCWFVLKILSRWISYYLHVEDYIKVSKDIWKTDKKHHQLLEHITMMGHVVDLSKPQAPTDWTATWYKAPGSAHWVMINPKGKLREQGLYWKVNRRDATFPETLGKILDIRGDEGKGKKILSPQITHIFPFLPRLQMVLHTHKHSLPALFFRKLGRIRPLLLFLWEDDYMLFLCFQALIFSPCTLSHTDLKSTTKCRVYFNITSGADWLQSYNWYREPLSFWGGVVCNLKMHFWNLGAY